MINIVICDDELQCQSIINTAIDEYMAETVLEYTVSRFVSGTELLQQLKVSNYQIIFLDIKMNDMDGLTVARKIREFDKNIIIAFISANINCSLEGYKVNAVRYILKDEKLNANIAECLHSILYEEYHINKMKFDFSNGTHEIALNELFYVESRSHKLVFHVMNNEMINYTMNRVKLNEIERKLSEKGFIRVHQSYLVNIVYISRIERYRAVLLNEKMLPIPKDRYKKVMISYALYKDTKEK